MVKLTRIYTRTGDDGQTGLGDASRVDKDHPRVAAYGEVDEANAAIGLAIAELDRDPDAPEGVAGLLRRLQQAMFDVGADLCVPPTPDEKPGQKLRIGPAAVEALEREIDRHNAGLGPLTSFVLPGGTASSAALHVARAATRRAERSICTLARAEPGRVGPDVIRFVNRLSDLLFVLARVANDDGRRDELWNPGSSLAKDES